MKIQLMIVTLGLAGLGGTLGLFSTDVHAASTHTSRHGNGQVKESTYFVGGERHGQTLRYYRDGTLRAEGEHENGKMVGHWLWQLPDGSRDDERSGTYEDGRRISI
jgi:antitoxin component YwqK of YwqJK toxin-antitoxin module